MHAAPSLQKRYFFCGIGGSGMAPLALYLKQKGHQISGSDRSNDNEQSKEKFDFIRNEGVILYPQDGSGINSNLDAVIVSSAVEESIEDIRSARLLNVPVIKRGALLASHFNAADISIAVAGTSGKSTVTGMIGCILTEMNLNPTVINGAASKNSSEESQAKTLTSFRCGREDIFIAEMDESDGSIAYYAPSISVLNNIAIDHKPIDELLILFTQYLHKTKRTCILNYGNKNIRTLVNTLKINNVISFGINLENVSLSAQNLVSTSEGVSFSIFVADTKEKFSVNLKVAGYHNAENALAALCVAKEMKLDLFQSCRALEKFGGMHRRLEKIGEKNGILVIDDFAHNPDKITASLKTLKENKKRLIIIFQIHGYGPLKMMRNEFVRSFADNLEENDILMVPEVFYAGGTVDRSVTAKDFVNDLCDAGRDARWFENRVAINESVKKIVKPGDCLVVMGARDDTLHDFAIKLYQEI